MSFACLCVLVKVNMAWVLCFFCELSPVELSSVSAFLVSVSVKHYHVEFWLLWLVNQVTISMDGGCKRRLIIVGIGGMSGAGKSTLAKLLCRHLAVFGFGDGSMATALRSIYSSICIP